MFFRTVPVGAADAKYVTSAHAILLGSRRVKQDNAILVGFVYAMTPCFARPRNRAELRHVPNFGSQSDSQPRIVCRRAVDARFFEYGSGRPGFA
jgi:hypothetical protein